MLTALVCYCQQVQAIPAQQEVLLSRKQDLAALQSTGQARPATKALTRNELLELAATGVQDDRRRHLNPRDLERGPLFLLRMRSTNGTSLAPVVAALQAGGVKVKRTMGSVMQVLELDRADLHHIFCYCHGEYSDGAAIASHLRMAQR
ncbi:MAG: hypothetical protein JWO84_79 [Parcubacteria group bacterium]|nr:hypothetical protein [Parcubacteria group bacterium]